MPGNTAPAISSPAEAPARRRSVRLAAMIGGLALLAAACDGGSPYRQHFADPPQYQKGAPEPSVPPPQGYLVCRGAVFVPNREDGRGTLYTDPIVDPNSPPNWSLPLGVTASDTDGRAPTWFDQHGLDTGSPEAPRLPASAPGNPNEPPAAYVCATDLQLQSVSVKGVVDGRTRAVVVKVITGTLSSGQQVDVNIAALMSTNPYEGAPLNYQAAHNVTICQAQRVLDAVQGGSVQQC